MLAIVTTSTATPTSATGALTTHLIHVRARRDHPFYIEHKQFKFRVPDDRCRWDVPFEDYRVSLKCVQRFCLVWFGLEFFGLVWNRVVVRK